MQDTVASQESDFELFEKEQKRITEKYYYLQVEEQFNAFRFNLMSSASKVMREWREKFGVSRPEKLALYIKLYQDSILEIIEEERKYATERPDIGIVIPSENHISPVASAAQTYIAEYDEDHEVNYNWVRLYLAWADALRFRMENWKFMIASKEESDIANTDSLESGPEGDEDFVGIDSL